MSLSIIVATLDEEKYLGVLLDSIASQDFDKPYEVVIIDASQNDRTLAVARSRSGALDLRLVKAARADVGLQRNLGASLAKYDHLLFLDADVILGPSALHRCASRIEGRRLAVVSIRHRADRRSPMLLAAMLCVYVLILAARAFRYPVTNGDFLLTNRATFAAIDGFRTGFLLGEDTDFGYRASRLGAACLMEWRPFIIASSRRLAHSSSFKLVFTWARAYLRVIRGRGPSGARVDDAEYPYGLWS